MAGALAWDWTEWVRYSSPRSMHDRGPLRARSDRRGGSRPSAEGFLTIGDLEKKEAEWWKPISIRYRGVDVVTASPPANAFDYLVRLGIMSRFEPQRSATTAPTTFAEVAKHGFWVRLRYAGDPDVAAPPIDRLLSE